jgi:phosphoglycolate phosphatase
VNGRPDTLQSVRPLIVFDLDGTIIDSKRDLAESANELLVRYHASPLPEEQVAGFVGDGVGQLVARTLAAREVEADPSAALDQYLSIYGERLFKHTRLYPGLSDAIAEISVGASIALLTNKPHGLAQELLDGFGLSRFFQWVIGGDSKFPRKPDPAALHYLMGEARIAPHQCLMVGDSMVDVETGRGAQATVCVAEYGFGHLRRPIVLDGSEFIARHSEDVAGILDRFCDLALASPGPSPGQ